MATRSSREHANAAATLALLLVGTLWVLCFVKAYLAENLSDKKIDAIGQFGDSFGAVNALFTGIALTGLAYTAFLQREEIDDNRESLRRERREQFLSARLNATTALFNAVATGPEGMFPDNQSLVYMKHRVEWQRRKYRLRLAILLHEAHLGFDEGPWTKKVELLAGCRFLLDECAEYMYMLEHESFTEYHYIDDYANEIDLVLLSVEYHFSRIFSMFSYEVSLQRNALGTRLSESKGPKGDYTERSGLVLVLALGNMMAYLTRLFDRYEAYELAEIEQHYEQAEAELEQD